MEEQQATLSRRGFFATAAVTAMGAILTESSVKATAGSAKKFKLKYAPSLGFFSQHAGADPIDEIKFMADEGFSAMFDNGLMGRATDLQEKIGKEMNARGMTLGPFVLYADFGVESFVQSNDETRKMLADKMKQGVETAKRTGAKWALVVPGHYDEKMEWDYQTANVVENLRRCVDAVEPSGLILVLEPLNRHNHPGLFLRGIPQAYEISRAVNRPCCKIVDDLYHQQITEGNLIPNIDAAWSEIASFHLGDNPGRNEPGTGEINFKNVFRHIAQKGYTGVLCMEHGKSKGDTKEAERAVIDAYRACDDFQA